MKVKEWRFKFLALAFAALIYSPPPGLAQQTESSVSGQSAESEKTAAAQKLPDGYYIEFRVAQIGAYGHSYVVYGTSGGRAKYADLHPMGGYAVMALGHVLPVPANTEWDPDVLKLPVAAHYRRSLDATQYRKLLVAVQTAKANKAPYWNALANNCNHFIGHLAEAVGLRVPNGTTRLSYFFVPALRELNESENEKTSPAAHKRRVPASPPA